MYRMADVRKQLTDAGVLADFYSGPLGWVPDQPPGRFIVGTPTPGVGQSADGTTDQAGLTLRIVGAQGDFEGAEDLAWSADRAVRRDQSGPWGYRHVVRVQRQGGGPAVDNYDPSSSRTHLILNYIVEAAAEVPGS